MSAIIKCSRFLLQAPKCLQNLKLHNLVSKCKTFGVKLWREIPNMLKEIAGWRNFDNAICQYVLAERDSTKHFQFLLVIILCSYWHNDKEFSVLLIYLIFSIHGHPWKQYFKTYYCMQPIKLAINQCHSGLVVQAHGKIYLPANHKKLLLHQIIALF